MQSNHATQEAAPDLSQRRELSLAELCKLDDPAVIFEYQVARTDAPTQWVYTVAGWLDGVNVATQQGGCTVGGDSIAVFAETREQADELACAGLDSTISAINAEVAQQAQGAMAAARLSAVGGMERLNQALRGDNPEFKRDMALLQAAGFGHAINLDAYQTSARGR